MESETNLSESELIQLRRQKLAAWRASGAAYPNDFHRSHYAGDLVAEYGEYSKEQLTEKPVSVKIAGRVLLRRIMGKASFLHLQDMTGSIQVYLKEEVLTEMYTAFKQGDLGDIVGVEGFLFRTKTDELTVHAQQFRLLSKSLVPLPDKFHGLHETELCYRKRYIDLIVNEKTRKTFQIRSHIIQGIREFLTARRFMEVETPMMQVIPGGATARPFVTHHHALDMDLYLRIAPELYLKRLVVGGFERVFEINRNFRNEGLSTRHNPEFTMVEFYQAYADYQDLMDLTEVLLRTLAERIFQNTTITYQGHSYDLSQPFSRMTLAESLLAYHKELKPAHLTDEKFLRSCVEKQGITVSASMGLGALQMALFEKNVESQLKMPTFITAYPAEVSPLARRNNQDPFITDRFELFMAGREVANGFSELNDPEDQDERFKQQAREKNAGDLEAMHYDADYIHALEVGLPPTAGEGIGIDRLAMFFSDSPSIRDVILFPHLRPETPVF